MMSGTKQIVRSYLGAIPVARRYRGGTYLLGLEGFPSKYVPREYIKNSLNTVVQTLTLRSTGEYDVNVLLQNGTTLKASHSADGSINLMGVSDGNLTPMSVFPNISGSIVGYNGEIANNSNQLLLYSDHDFVVGQGISIEGAGNYRDGWLRTTITAISGHLITLADVSTAAMTGLQVEHDDSVAVQSAIDSCTSAVLVWNIMEMYIHDISIPSNMHHYGKGCMLYNPKYLNQDTPSLIWPMFESRDLVNVSFIGFYMNGGKQYGVNGNDQCGAPMFNAVNLDGGLFVDLHIEESYSLGLWMLGSIKNVEYAGCQIDNTDVAILHMPEYNDTAYFENIGISENSISATGCNSEAIAVLPTYYKWKDYTTGEILAVSKDIRIVNNTVIKRDRVAVVLGGVSDNVLFKGNTVEAMIAVAAYDGNGELRDELSVSQSAWCETDNVVITENNFAYSQYSVLTLGGNDWDIYNNVFSQDASGSKISDQDAKVKGTVSVHDQDIYIDGWYNFIKGDFDDLQFYNNTMRTDVNVNVIDVAVGKVSAYNNDSIDDTVISVPAGSVIEGGNFTTVNVV